MTAAVTAPPDRRAAPAAAEAVEISVLIVGYRSADLLRDCLSGLFAHTSGVAMEVLYVDCSNDGSVEMVRTEYPSVRVVDNRENLGFGRGNNLLARHARGEFLLLLNADTLIRDNAVGALLACARAHPECGAWGGVTVLPDGRIEPGSQQTGPGLRYDLLRLFGLSRLVRGGLPAGATEAGEVDVLCGAFMMVPRTVWEQLGGFDETFFLYCEEVDFCYRLQRAGYRILMTPRSRIVHLVGSGEAQSPGRMVALTRGAIHLERKHFGRLHNWGGIGLRWLYSLVRYLGGVLGPPLLGRERAARLRERHRDIVLRPWIWSRGWQDFTRTSSP